MIHPERKDSRSDGAVVGISYDADKRSGTGWVVLCGDEDTVDGG